MTADRKSMLRDFLAANPKDSFARYGLAMEYANSGDVEAALAQFKKLLEINPDYTAAYQMSAQALMKAGRQNDAEARKMLTDGIACAARTGNAHARSEMQAMLDELG